MSRRTHTLALAGLAALAAVSLSACGDVDGSAHSVAPAASTATATTAPATPSATPSATPAPVAAAPVAPAKAAPAPARNPGGTTGGGSTSGGGGTNTGGNNGGGGGVSGPKIVSFSVSKPDCSAGNVTATWRVTGADGAAIAVDNPDIYGAFGSDYPATGRQELPFSCGSGTTKHTYTLWPAGAKSVSRTISISATPTPDAGNGG
jgi:hypothetical protein